MSNAKIDKNQHLDKFPNIEEPWNVLIKVNHIENSIRGVEKNMFILGLLIDI